jgi:hypothetical protein
MLRRYKRVALLWVILATALAPATARTAYAAVAPPAPYSVQSETRQGGGEHRFSVEPFEETPRATFPRAARRDAAGRPAAVPAVARLYLLHHALLR